MYRVALLTGWREDGVLYLGGRYHIHVRAETPEDVPDRVARRLDGAVPWNAADFGPDWGIEFAVPWSKSAGKMGGKRPARSATFTSTGHRVRRAARDGKVHNGRLDGHEDRRAKKTPLLLFGAPTEQHDAYRAFTPDDGDPSAAYLEALWKTRPWVVGPGSAWNWQSGVVTWDIARWDRRAEWEGLDAADPWFKAAMWRATHATGADR